MQCSYIKRSCTATGRQLDVIIEQREVGCLGGNDVQADGTDRSKVHGEVVVIEEDVRIRGAEEIGARGGGIAGVGAAADLHVHRLARAEVVIEGDAVQGIAAVDNERRRHAFEIQRGCRARQRSHKGGLIGVGDERGVCHGTGKRQYGAQHHLQL